MLKKIDSYLLRRFVSRIIFLLFSITTIIVLTNIVELIDNFIDANMSNGDILNYYLVSLPLIISYAVPITVTIATVLTITTYIKHNELIAIRAVGISYPRFIRLILVLTSIISISHFYFENNIVSIMNKQKEEMEKKFDIHQYNKGKYKKNKLNNFVENISTENKFVIISNYNYKNKTAKDISINLIDSNNKIIDRIDAEKMKWDTIHQKWKIENYNHRYWKDGKMEYENIKEGILLSLKNITPEYLTTEFIGPEQMNYFELRDFIKIKKNNSGNTTRWEVSLNHKISYAASSFILSVLSIFLALGGNNSNISYGLGMSIIVIALYYLLLLIGKNLGLEGIVSPIISAWLGSFLLLLLSSTIYFKKMN